MASCCHIRIEPGTDRAGAVCAGHCPPLLRRPDGRTDALEPADGPLLGVDGTRTRVSSWGSSSRWAASSRRPPLPAVAPARGVRATGHEARQPHHQNDDRPPQDLQCKTRISCWTRPRGDSGQPEFLKDRQSRHHSS
ncbi:SpoIIE family protein phosphatase [Streptomyces sp. CB03911]|uniref:SpoIIE family protein phosphatase n=1 Tax=Streptomyces sp. CB03911 TaxID=1804758 RepID=UPI00093F5952